MSSTCYAPCTCHATCLVLFEAGVLIRGAAGSGKSSLALALLDRGAQEGFHASLVGDDRIGLERHHGRIVARGHPALAGLVELRGLGLLRAASRAEAAIVRLVVDLVEALPRLPDAGPAPADLLGVAIPVLVLDRSMRAAGLGPRLVLDTLAQQGSVALRTHSPAVSRGACGAM